MKDLPWLIALPFMMIALAAYLVLGFMYETAFGNNEDMRDPCERGYFDKALQKVIIT